MKLEPKIRAKFPPELQAARVTLLRELTYYRALLVRLVPVEWPGLADVGPGPIGVDQFYRVYYDPKVISQWKRIVAVSILRHEVEHLRREHYRRRGSRDPLRWNIAGDAAINGDLLQEGRHNAFPKGVITPKSLKLPPHLTAEEYYKRLPKEGDQGSGKKGGKDQGEGSGSASDGIKRAWELDEPKPGEPGVGKIERELVKHEVARAVQEAVKQAGNVPAGLQRWADAILKPKVRWPILLQRHVRRVVATVAGAGDYTYSRVSRRQDPADPIIHPATRRPVPKIGILIDASQSMDNKRLSRAVSETSAFIRRLALPESVFVVACDVDVSKVRFRIGDKRWAVEGGGGTDLRNGLQYLEKQFEPDVTVVITDCETPWPDQAPSYPVIVVNVGDGDAPDWATTIKVED